MPEQIEDFMPPRRVEPPRQPLPAIRRDMSAPAEIVERMTADMRVVGNDPNRLFRRGWTASQLVHYWHRAEAAFRGVPFMVDRHVEVTDACIAAVAAAFEPRAHTGDMVKMLEDVAR